MIEESNFKGVLVKMKFILMFNVYNAKEGIHNAIERILTEDYGYIKNSSIDTNYYIYKTIKTDEDMFETIREIRSDMIKMKNKLIKMGYHNRIISYEISLSPKAFIGELNIN